MDHQGPLGPARDILFGVLIELGPDPDGDKGRRLRRLVIEHRARDPRRIFPPVLAAGTLAWSIDQVVGDGEHHDAALRLDVAGALLERVAYEVRHPWAWLTRPGVPELHDLDLVWTAAVRHAAAELNLPTRFVIVTRTGWLEPHTGRSRVWRRPRRRS